MLNHLILARSALVKSPRHFGIEKAGRSGTMAYVYRWGRKN